MERLLIWIRLVTAIGVIVSSCVGLGYVVGVFAQRRKWTIWITGPLSLAVALLWPIMLVAYVIYDARRYLALHPHDDAPGMVVVSMISVGAPFVFFISLPLVFTGLVFGKRRNAGEAIRQD